MQIVTRYMKRCSTSLIIREMPIKITTRYPLVLVRMAIIKRREINVGKDVEKRELFYTLGENINWYSHYGKHYGESSKN